MPLTCFSAGKKILIPRHSSRCNRCTLLGSGYNKAAKLAVNSMFCCFVKPDPHIQQELQCTLLWQLLTKVHQTPPSLATGIPSSVFSTLFGGGGLFLATFGHNDYNVHRFATLYVSCQRRTLRWWWHGKNARECIAGVPRAPDSPSTRVPTTGAAAAPRFSQDITLDSKPVKLQSTPKVVKGLQSWGIFLFGRICDCGSEITDWIWREN